MFPMLCHGLFAENLSSAMLYRILNVPSTRLKEGSPAISVKELQHWMEKEPRIVCSEASAESPVTLQA